MATLLVTSSRGRSPAISAPPRGPTGTGAASVTLGAGGGVGPAGDELLLLHATASASAHTAGARLAAEGNLRLAT